MLVPKVAAPASAGVPNYVNVDKYRATRFVRLITQTIAERTWSCTYHMNTWPDIFAGMMDKSDEMANWTAETVRETWGHIQHAEEKLLADECPLGLEKLLGAVGFHKHTVCREAMAVFEAAEWNPRDPNVVEFLSVLFRVPGDTKTYLED